MQTGKCHADADAQMPTGSRPKTNMTSSHLSLLGGWNRGREAGGGEDVEVDEGQWNNLSKNFPQIQFQFKGAWQEK